MKAVRGAKGLVGVAVVVLALAQQPMIAQKKQPAANSPEHTRQVLVGNAHALESRGRPDMAIQIWQQILLSDPNNAEALAGLARDYKLSGSQKEADEALDKLRRVNPNDPNIGKIQSLTSTRAQSSELRQAGDLARQGKNDDAMRIYRNLYGDRPPDGDIALAYYQTLYGTASGKQQAIAGMRALAARNPGDPRYVVSLGRMLSYDARTRSEGIHILQEHSQDPDAREALRQAILWDAANPSAAGELKGYLKAHPNDAEVATRLKEDESKLSQMNSGIARTPEERAAFAALNGHRLDEAQRRFMALLEKEPNNGRASAGMGFLRMQQSNFAGAVSYLTQAEQSGYRTATVENALRTSRFWYTMGEASQAVNENQFELAADKYRESLAMRPHSPEALNGLAGLYMKQQQYAQAAGVYEEILKSAPRDTDAWRGLFLSYARDGQNDKALALSGRFPVPVRTALSKDPDYLRTLATIYTAEGRSGDAQRVLSQALALPFPENGAHLKSDTRLQYAGILMESRRYDQAAALYDQVLRDDPSNLSAWMGLVSAHHQLNQDNTAINDVERMPPATYEAALNDAGFLSMLGGMYAQANQFDIAQNLLERAVRMQQASGGQPSLSVQLQLAGIYLQRGNTTQSYAIYRQILTAHPDRVDAWKGLIAALQGTNHTHEAIQQIGYIPPAVRKQLETDPAFVQTEASLYAAAGDTPHAIEYMNRVQQHYAQLHQAEPADISIQSAWLLYNTKNDRALYPALMRLGGRQDLTPAQREVVQTIWANWAVRRAGTAIDSNDNDRAVEILEAANAAFPENEQVKKVLAGGYLRTGQARESLAIYKSVSMQDASATDFQGAVGAALAANDKAQAELWLREGLQRYPNSYVILGMAARFEQARGDNQRAADYWRAAIAAMPAGSPTDRLAHDLAYPDISNKTHKAMSSADLARLLNPAEEPFQKTTKLPPLPAYGPDPYLGSAPVMLNNQPQSIAQQTQVPTAPSTTTIEVPDNSVVPSRPATTPRPAPQSAPQPAPQYTAPSGTASMGTASPSTASSGITTAPKLPHRKRRSSSATQGSGTGYTGQVHLPASEENIQTAAPVTTSPTAPAEAAPQQPVFIPAPQDLTSPAAPSTQPADNPAPQSPQPIAPPTDNGVPPVFVPVPQASADNPAGADPNQVRALGNAPIVLPNATRPKQQTSEAMATNGADLSGVQYTPSAQEAATGAYSAQRQQQQATPQQTTQQNSVQPALTPQGTPTQQPPAKKRTAGKRVKKESVPTLVTAPAEQTPEQSQQQAPPVIPVQQEPGTAPAQPAGASDDQLQQENLPPLRGPWIKIRREAQPVSPRDEAEQQLRSLESGYSGWLGGTGLINYRSGNLGYDRLSVLEAPFEISTPLGYHARFTFVVKPVFLDSGQADGTAIVQVQETTTAGTSLLTIPEPLGTDTNTGPTTTTGTTTTTAGTPPPQQNATGIGGEVQLAFPHLALAAGYTPYGFLVSNWTARANWRPGDGPFTFTFNRDSVKDTQLSYAGMRDPGTMSLSFPGAIWGGVVANQGNVQFARGDANSGFYVGAGGQYLSGYQVQTNSRFDGTGGAYWRIKAYPEYGTLSIGANFFGMHYAHNQQAFTYGMGGYFSPQAYFLANIPFTWTGHVETHWHYEVLGGLGVQAFQQDKTPLFPMANQQASEIALNNAALPAMTSVGANYNLRGNFSYQIGPHWFAGGFLTANNSRNYNSVSAGFSIHYTFRTQPSAVTTPTGLFPNDGLRPFTVP